MRALISALLVAAALVPFGLRPASAQAADVVAELMIQCRRDAAELCGDVEPGGMRIAACLYSRINDLSPRCHRAMSDGIALRACGREYHRFCGDVPVGDGLVAKCLRDFRDEVSPRCYGALTSGRKHYGERGWSERRWTDRRYDAPPVKEYRRKKYVEEEVEEQYDQGPDPDLK
jgi:hypothetical protein